jgi:hypothetical protein
MGGIQGMRIACCVCVYGSGTQKDEERERETAETGKLQFKVAHVSTSTFNSDPKAGAGQSSNTYRDRHFWGARGQPWTHPPFPESPAEHVKPVARRVLYAKPESSTARRRKRPNLSLASPVADSSPCTTSQISRCRESLSTFPLYARPLHGGSLKRNGQ